MAEEAAKKQDAKSRELEKVAAKLRRLSAAMVPIIAALDHQNINDVLPCSTTAENLGAWIMSQLDKHSGLKPRVSRVDVYETAKTCVRVER